MIRTYVTSQLFVVVLISISNIAYAEDCSPWVAKAISVQGNVERLINSDQLSMSSTQWLPIKRDDELCAGEMIRVKQNSRAALILKNDTILRLNQNTTITLSSLSEDQSHWINLEQGIAHFIARIKQSFKVITPFVNAAVEGTEFVVSVNDTQTEVTVFEGKVNVKNELGEIRLIKGQTATTTAKSIPALTIRVKPRDAVQWSLYYPAIINFNSSDYQNFDPDSKIIIERSITAARDGQYTTALKQINLVRKAEINTTLLIYRAALYLSVGRIEKAKQDIHQVIQKQPDNAQAIALQAIFAIVQNNKTRALALAEQAATMAPNSASTALALSYVHQSLFDIDTALKVIKTATTINKNNALLWSRLSELYLMVGDLDEALKAAKQANELNPNIARTHSALGFAYLTRIEVKKAEQAFRDAIERDDTDPLSRLGLGLAIIRQGDLEEGRREIEYASILDPNNALIRSYLGKAYYEEKRNKLASIQFEMAKQLDPNDPTPYYYSAVKKLSINRPSEALFDLLLSIELNNNRSINRSKLKLDQDIAAQSANLAQIYKELAFEVQAQNESYKSLSEDISNHSAHRFLTDAYRLKPRHEIARVSEALQSQLLAPINIKPTSPSLSEVSLGVHPNASSNQSQFSDYDPLFTKNSNRFDLSVITGNQQTSGDQFVYSSLHDDTVISVGQYHYQTEGFRDNNDLQQDIFNFFIQSEFSPNHSFQFEFKHNKKENGDLDLKFNPNNFSKNKREDEKIDSFRLGYRFNLTPSSKFLVSFIFQDELFNRSNNEQVSPNGPFGPIIAVDEIHSDINDKNSEIQYISNYHFYSFVTGASYTNQEGEELSTFLLTSGGNVISGSPKTITIDDTSKNVYIYNYFKLTNSINLTIAFNNEYYDSVSGISENQISPKLGFTWDITPDTNFRIAGFQTLKRKITSNQTIEPTHIAGFNQLFDDPTATDAKRYGIALNSHITNNFYLGLELTARNLTIPSRQLNGTILYKEQDENLHQVFLNWVISNNYALNLAYIYENFKKVKTQKLSLNQPRKLNTKKLPIGFSYHNSN